jgi:hypothetical protein
MNSYQKFYDLFWTVLEQLPSLVTILACLIFTLVRWKRYPRVAPLVLVSLVLLFLHGPIFAAVYNWVPDLLIDRSRSTNYGISSNVMIVLGLIYQTALAIPFTLLLISIFMQRNPAAGETSA